MTTTTLDAFTGNFIGRTITMILSIKLPVKASSVVVVIVFSSENYLIVIF
jgi:hypothetical protein